MSLGKENLANFCQTPLLADLCYTFIMDSKQHIWQIWAENLHRWGLKDIVAVLLEAGGPLNLVFAQGLYLIQPLFTTSVSKKNLETLAEVLESTEETHLFVTFLREGSLT